MKSIQKTPSVFVQLVELKVFSRFILTFKNNLVIMYVDEDLRGIPMNINDIILDVIANTTNEEGKPIRQVEIIERIKDKFQLDVTQAAFSDRLKNKNMKTNTVIEILDVLGYELVARPKKGGRQEYIAERGEGRSK
jgi:hypothetical protein